MPILRSEGELGPVEAMIMRGQGGTVRDGFVITKPPIQKTTAPKKKAKKKKAKPASTGVFGDVSTDNRTGKPAPNLGGGEFRTRRPGLLAATGGAKRSTILG
jgi:hypothetical protein